MWSLGFFVGNLSALQPIWRLLPAACNITQRMLQAGHVIKTLRHGCHCWTFCRKPKDRNANFRNIMGHLLTGYTTGFHHKCSICKFGWFIYLDKLFTWAQAAWYDKSRKALNRSVLALYDSGKIGRFFLAWDVKPSSLSKQMYAQETMSLELVYALVPISDIV